MSYYYSTPVKTNYSFNQTSSTANDLAAQFPTMITGQFTTPTSSSSAQNISIPLYQLGYNGTLSSTNPIYIQNILFSTFGLSGE